MMPIGPMGNGVFTVTTAQMVRPNLNMGIPLDFSDVTSVEDGAWSALFDGDADSIILEKNAFLKSMSSELKKNFVAWLTAQSQPAGKSPRIENPTMTDRTFEDFTMPFGTSASRPYTPRRLVSRLREDLVRYLESAHPLVNSHLLSERRHILRHGDDGKILAQEPYIETTPRYKSSSKGYLDLEGVDPDTRAFLDRLSKQKKEFIADETVLYPSMYTHQAEALEAYLGQKKDLIVATGTGSGKTECFLVPTVGHLYEEAKNRPQSFAKRGVRAMVLYPLNALVNDQLSRMRQLIGDANVAETFRKQSGASRHPVFGMYTGRTTYPGKKNDKRDHARVAPILEYYLGLDAALKTTLKVKGKYPAKDLEAFYAQKKERYTTNSRQERVLDIKCWKERLLTNPNDCELFTRQEMVRHGGIGNAPDVIITNYFMLEYMLIRPFERPLFQQTKEWLEADEKNEFLLILDEAHMYRGSQGAEVSFLLRRLRARLGLHDQPHRFRIICTSASLGSGEKAQEEMQAFAADLVGKEPGDFEPISGQRDIPYQCEKGDESLLTVLSSMNVEKLLDVGFQLDDPDEIAKQNRLWKKELEPLFAYYNAGDQLDKAETFEDILATLERLLKGSSLINLLLSKTAGSAQSLSQLSEMLFVDGVINDKEEATQNLLSLANIARPHIDSPGLIPTRMHIFFKGLEGLYACINPECSGKVSHKEELTKLGKLFSEPRLKCDACDARVFELSSCRRCGNGYIEAYTIDETHGPQTDLENPPIPNMDFLFGHMAENATKVQLLITKPQFGTICETTEQCKSGGTCSKLSECQNHQNYACDGLHVDKFTGYIENAPTANTRKLWAYKTHPTKPDGTQNKRAPKVRFARFEKCAMCTPGYSASKAQITSFGTKGELAFTSLIKTQFAEQPAQSKPTFKKPNGGRKVLIFSDGRQKAAKLAPALEYTHNVELLRQLIVKAISKFSERNPDRKIRLQDLNTEIFYWCVVLNVHLGVGADASSSWTKFFLDQKRKFVELQRKNMRTAKTEFYKALLKEKMYDSNLFNDLFLAKAVYLNFVSRYFSLSALGIANLVVSDSDFDRLNYASQYQFKIQLPEEHVKIILQQLMTILLERRALVVPGMETDTQVGEHHYDKPSGIDVSNNRQVFPLRFTTYLYKIFNNDYTRVQHFYDMTYDWIIGANKSFDKIGAEYFIANPEVELASDTKYLCSGCGRIHLIQLQNICPACASDKVYQIDADYLESRFGHVYQQLKNIDDKRYLEPFSLVTAEHSANIKATENDEAFSRAEEFELRFQDILLDREDKGHSKNSVAPIDVLSCTTTMEVGIDIGALCGVALRNVPPQVANYQQRSGRAGRRGTSLASVLTYAQGGTHDRHYFKNPHEIISGDVLSPIVYVENQQIFLRHIHAYYIQRFFHEVVSKGKGATTHRLFDALGTLGAFLNPKKEHSVYKFKQWLRDNQVQLHKEVVSWSSTYSHSRDITLTEVDDTIKSSIDTLIQQLDTNVPLEKYEKYVEGILSEEENLQMELALKENLLDLFMTKAILPRYAFPMDVVNFHVVKNIATKNGRPEVKLAYSPDRDLQIALSEYAPGNQLTINKRKYTSTALFDVYKSLSEMVPVSYIECPRCHYVATHVSTRPTECPSCGEVDILHQVMKRPIGFATDRREHQAPIDTGRGTQRFGFSTSARLVVQERQISDWDRDFIDSTVHIKAETKRDLLVVNKGLAQSGFVMCSDCGRIEPQIGRTFSKSQLFKGGVPTAHTHPIFGKPCGGVVNTEESFFLGYEFPTDLLLIKLTFPKNVSLQFTNESSNTAIKSVLTTLVEALSQATTRVLQIDSNEIAGNYTTLESAKPNEAYLFLYDILSGGAGYTIGIKDQFGKILEVAEDILDECTCEASCYNCLRHYGNQLNHGSLHRVLALNLLQTISKKQGLSVSSDMMDYSLSGLIKYLELKSIDYERGTHLEEASIPLKITRSDGNDLFVMIVHPLLCAEAVATEVQRIQNAHFEIVVPVDWYTLQYNLPMTLRKLRVLNG